MALIEEYDARIHKLVALASKLDTLISDLLVAEDIRVHSIATRVKDRASLETKIAKSAGKYLTLEQITDLCGARIITYFEDQVAAVCKLIEREFDIDPLNSVDKRQVYDPDRFGYLSVHYVATLSAPRCQLAEYARFQGLKFELQVRSILQHAWAEIEHDLQYKTKEAIPREFRRRFARLAGLLEIADDEFRGIRDAIDEYQRHVAVAVTAAPSEVSVDQDSLLAFVAEDEVVASLDHRIADVIGVPVTNGTIDSTFLLKVLSEVRIRTIQALRSELISRGERVVEFARVWILRPDPERSGPISYFVRGISLIYLAYYLLLTIQSDETIKKIVASSYFADPDGLIADLRQVFSQL